MIRPAPTRFVGVHGAGLLYRTTSVFDLHLRDFNVEEPTVSELVLQGKTYVYDKRRYLFDVQLPVVIATIAFFVAGYFSYAGVVAPIAIGVMLLCVYVVFNTLVARTYPQTVSLTGEELQLTSFGRTDAYRIDELTRLQVRENGMTRNAYIRVNGGGLMRGRYFVACGDLYDEEGAKALDLYQFFLDTEARLDPENLRVRSRAINAKKGAQAEGESSKSSRKSR